MVVLLGEEVVAAVIGFCVFILSMSMLILLPSLSVWSSLSNGVGAGAAGCGGDGCLVLLLLWTMLLSFSPSMSLLRSFWL